MRKFLIGERRIPKALGQRLLLICLLCLLCLIVGAAVFFMLRDKVMLFLTLLLCGMGLCKAAALYRVAVRGAYEAVEGVCVRIVPKPLQKRRKVELLDAQGNTLALLLDKRLRFKIGCRYRLYFQKMPGAAQSGPFLGAEELGDFLEEASQ